MTFGHCEVRLILHNIWQSIWDKSEVLICRTCWATHCELGEHIGNPLGTYREHRENTLGNREKWKKNPSTVRPASGEASFFLFYIKSTHRTCRDSPVPSPAVLATVTASQPLSRAQHAHDLQGLSRAPPAAAGHRHSQSFTTSVPSTGLKPELRQGRTDVVNLYIRYSISICYTPSTIHSTFCRSFYSVIVVWLHKIWVFQDSWLKSCCWSFYSVIVVWLCKIWVLQDSWLKSCCWSCYSVIVVLPCEAGVPVKWRRSSYCRPERR